MNRPLLFIAFAGIAVAGAVLSNRDLQRERARAEVLAARLAELEPVERSTSSPAIERLQTVQPSARDLAVERSETRPASSNTEQEESRPPRKTYPGSAQARTQVERLQAALVAGTPLQEYQIRALITAIDEVLSGIERESKTRPSIDWEQERRQRLIQAAADILFESQMERYIELLNAGSNATSRDGPTTPGA